jgi:hypothetical protein
MWKHIDKTPHKTIIQWIEPHFLLHECCRIILQLKEMYLTWEWSKEDVQVAWDQVSRSTFTEEAKA